MFYPQVSLIGVNIQLIYQVPGYNFVLFLLIQVEAKLARGYGVTNALAHTLGAERYLIGGGIGPTHAQMQMTSV